MDIKTLMEISKASAGAMTADVAVLGLKLVFGDTLGGVLGTGLKEFLKKYKDMPETELKQIPVPEDIAEEIKNQVELYLKDMKQKHPVSMNGVVFFFEQPLSDEDAEDIKNYMEEEYEETYAGCYTPDDFGIYEDTFYINFLDTHPYEEDTVCNMINDINEYLEAKEIINYVIFQ